MPTGLIVRHTRRAGVCIALAVMAGGCRAEPETSGSSSSAGEPRGVVIVLIDALRADHLGTYGYARATSPHMDALAADGTVFLNAMTTAPWTLPAMGSMWTGLYPSVHGATRRSSEVTWITNRKKFRPLSILVASRTTLAELLKAQGFRTAAFTDGVYPGKVFGFDQGFELFVEEGPEGARMNVEAMFAWLDRQEPRRFLAYLHLVDVHSPYMAPTAPPWVGRNTGPEAQRVRALIEEERRRYASYDFDPGYEGRFDGSPNSLAHLRGAYPDHSPRDLEHAIARYDQGIAYTDYWMGRIVAGLRDRGLYESTTIVITSDHGEEFLEHGALEHGANLYDEVMRIPLIIRDPVGRGRRVEEQVGLIDFTPTMLDLLSLPIPDGLHGMSARPSMTGGSIPADRLLYAEADQGERLKVMRSHRFKFIRNGKRPELYDLRSDPGEKQNLCSGGADCGDFQTILRTWEEQMKRDRGVPTTPVAAQLSDEDRERLRALGYSE